MSLPWETIARRKKAEQASKIPDDWKLPVRSKPWANLNQVLDVPRRSGLLTKQELDITENSDATALADAIATGELKSFDVVTAFCKRAAIAHQVTNCLTEIFFDQALSRAAALDDHLASGKPPLGPLHGVPISLKDSLKVQGHDASIGYASLCFKPARSNSTLVDLLLKAGAVLYCKTNVPQTLMQLDSHNNVFGRTLNPHNLMVTAGGSTGGEGALIAMRGSVLGVGTDVGGSIRIPAMCNGIYGVKPSWQRVPYAGFENGTLPGSSRISLAASAGPLGASLRDCELFLRAVTEQEPWKYDPDVVRQKWEEEDSTVLHKKPLIGVVRRDGLIEPLPPVAKMLDEVVASLRKQGVEVVEMNIAHLFSQCQSLANNLMGVDGGNYMFDLLEATEEPLSPWLNMRIKRRNPMTLEEVRVLQARRTGLETEMLKAWKDKKDRTIDAFICPVAPHPVPPIDSWNGVSYTSSFVLLDYAAGTVPVRTIRANDLHGNVPLSDPLSSWDKRNRELWTEIDRSVYLNTPLNIQIVAPKLEEQRLLRAMAVVDNAVKASSNNEHPRL